MQESQIIMTARESELHGPIATWLKAQGYHVSAEVKHCDMVATHPDLEDPVILEFKTRLSLDLVAQAVERQTISPSVYVVVPLHGAAARIRNRRRILLLLGRLELGLLVVRRLRTGTRVEVVRHPVPGTRARRHRKRRAILREIDSRYAELNTAGQANDRPRYSAYRQKALLTAELLRVHGGELSPRQLRSFGAPQDCQSLLSSNLYGWFERPSRGLYRLSRAGSTVVETESGAIQEIIEARDHRADIVQRGGSP